MIGKVESIDYEDDAVRLVRLTFPQRECDGTSGGALMSMDIHMCECIGKGSFGTVYRAVTRDYPKLAVKISTGKATRLKQELEVLRRVCTKGALQLPRFEFGALNQTTDLVVIGMELCMPCTLHDLLLSTRLTSTRDMLFIAHQAVQAVGCVHDEGCIHRDVKLQNYVFDSQGNLKLIDFGLSCNTLKPPAGDVVAGTVSFMSPEMAHNALHKEQRVSVGASADVWSLGIVLFSIFTQRNPYPNTAVSTAAEASKGDSADVDNKSHHSEGTTVSQKRINETLLRCVSRGEWQWPVGCTIPSELKQLVNSILIVNPEQRPTVHDILAMKVWHNRARVPPTAVTAFLGVHDELLFASNNEETLLRAVEQRSEGVKASQMQSRPTSRCGSQVRRANGGEGWNEEDEDTERRLQVTDAGKRDSLKFVATETASVGGVPSVHVYDVRASTKKRSKPIREISQVIAEETAKSQNNSSNGGTRRARSAKSKSALRTTSATAPSPRMPSRGPSAPTSRAGSRARANPGKSSSEAELTDAATPQRATSSDPLDAKNSHSTLDNSSGDVSAANDGGERHTNQPQSDDQAIVCTRLEDHFDFGAHENEEEVKPANRKHAGQGCLSRSEPAVPTADSLHLTSTTAANKTRAVREEVDLLDSDSDEYETTSERRKTTAVHAAPRPRSRDTTLRERSSSILSGLSRPGSREASLHVRRVAPYLSSRQGSSQAAPVAPVPSVGDVTRDTEPSADPFLSDTDATPASVPHAPVSKSKRKVRGAKKRQRSVPRHALSTDDAVKPLTPSKKLVFELNMDVFLQQEHDCRALLTRRLTLEYEWLMTAFRIRSEEDQERAHIVWNGTEQLANLEHPHKFKELVEIPGKAYANGFTCDACLYDFFPHGRGKRELHFFHCSCGQDLCPDCHRDYARRCTCACCAVIHPNLKALREHTRSGISGCRPRAAAGIVPGAATTVADFAHGTSSRSAAPPSSLGSTSRLAASRGHTAAAAAGSTKTISPAGHLKRSGKSSTKSATVRMGIGKGAMQQRLYVNSEAGSYDDAFHPDADNEETDLSDGADGDDDDALERDEEEESSHGRARRGGRRGNTARQRPPPVSPHFEKTIEELPKGPWRPFEKLRRDRNEVDPARMPTPQERNAMLNGEWLRYFHFYPPVETEQTFAFVYHAQPGRTGAVFLNNEFSIHSAVFSMPEHQFFVVDSIRMECPAEEDSTLAMPLAMAKSHARVKGAYRALESIVAHDTNMAKQQRAPGTMSVYFPPTNTFMSKGDPVLYVRWFRCSADRRITAILLSNGALQVFVNNEFELRWFDPERKFLIGKNGTCEVIDDETFELAPLINDVLYSTYDV